MLAEWAINKAAEEGLLDGREGALGRDLREEYFSTGHWTCSDSHGAHRAMHGGECG